MRPLRILTWHIHGHYLYYLSQVPHQFFTPYRKGGGEGYGGLGNIFPWERNVHQVPAERVAAEQFDCILFQTRKNYEIDQYEILSEEQRRLPRIYLEHDPPQEHPSDQRHWVDDPNVQLVHVTPFNALMWDGGRTPVRVIEYGVKLLDMVCYTGEVERGLVVINNLASRGRRLGRDIFEQTREMIPLDLIGKNALELGGIGEIHPLLLPAFEARYRFLFNPTRYTSLGLAVIEAMMIGMPILALATTEMATTIENDVSGYISNDSAQLVAHARRLLENPLEARMLGEGARRRALQRFSIHRFVDDWNRLFEEVTGGRTTTQLRTPNGEPVQAGGRI